MERLTTPAIRSKTAQALGPFILFEGCTMSRRMVGSRFAAQFVLDKYGFEYTILDQERCCGAPVMRSGAQEESIKLREYNLELFVRAGYSLIVTACPGCGSQLQCDAATARGLTVKHYIELIYLLAKNGELYLPEHMRAVPELTVTAHYPCHLHRGMGVSLGNRDPDPDDNTDDGPRAGERKRRLEPDRVDIYRVICDAFPMLSYVELPDKAVCCGAGGGVRASQKDLSYKIRERKIENIKRIEADICLAACPFCELQIDEGLRAELEQLPEGAPCPRAITPQGMIAVMFPDIGEALDTL